MTCLWYLMSFDNLTFDIWHNAGEGFDGEKKGCSRTPPVVVGVVVRCFFAMVTVCTNGRCFVWEFSKGGCLLH